MQCWSAQKQDAANKALVATTNPNLPSHHRDLYNHHPMASLPQRRSYLLLPAKYDMALAIAGFWTPACTAVAGAAAAAALDGPALLVLALLLLFVPVVLGQASAVPASIAQHQDQQTCQDISTWFWLQTLLSSLQDGNQSSHNVSLQLAINGCGLKLTST